MLVWTRSQFWTWFLHVQNLPPKGSSRPLILVLPIIPPAAALASINAAEPTDVLGRVSTARGASFLPVFLICIDAILNNQNNPLTKKVHFNCMPHAVMSYIDFLSFLLELSLYNNNEVPDGWFMSLVGHTQKLIHVKLIIVKHHLAANSPLCWYLYEHNNQITF